MWKPLSITACPSRFDCHSSIASAKVMPFGWMMKSTWHVVPPNAADDLARLEVVDGDRAPEGHVEMGVRVDAAREDVLPRRVDHLVGLDVERLADQRDRLVLDVDVADVVVRGRDDAAALDQNGHRLPPERVAAEYPSGGHRVHPTRPRRPSPRRSAPQSAPFTSTPSAFSASTRPRVGRRCRRRSGLVLDHPVVDGDLRRVLEVVGIHDPDPEIVRPDQLVDLVQLPVLMALAERRPVVEHDLEALVRVVAAEDPAPEARLQEALAMSWLPSSWIQSLRTKTPSSSAPCPGRTS